MKIYKALRGSLLAILLCGTVLTTPQAVADTKKPDKADKAAADNKDEDRTPNMPSNVAGNYLSGEFARNTGNMEQAVRYMQRVFREQPDNMKLAIQLEGMLILQGDVEEATKVADKIAANPDTKDPLADLLLVLREMKQKDPEGAASILAQVVAKGNSQLWVPLVTAWVEIARNGLSKPVAISGISADGGRAVPLVNYHLALINARAGFKEAAAKNFKAAIDNPKDPSKRVMNYALRFQKENNSPILAPLVKTYLAANPDTPDEGIYPPITEPLDGIAEVLYSMGGVMFAAGSVNDASIYLQLAVYARPDFAEAYMALGDTYNELQQYERSNEMYAKVPPSSPSYMKMQMRVAISQDKLGKEKEALASLEDLAAKFPKEPEPLVTKGDLYRIHGKYAEAVDSYTLALKRVPEIKSIHWPVFFARGSCLERLGKWEESERDLKQALELRPDQPDVLNYLAYGWLEHGKNVKQARAMLEKAVKSRPEDPQIVDSMGWALYLEGDYAGSLKYLEQAIELLPSDPTVNDHLGDVYWQSGRKTEARFQWDRALTYSPEPKLADAIRKKLKEGMPAQPSTLAAGADNKTVDSATP